MARIVDLRKELPRHKTRKWKKRTKVDSIVVHTTASDNQDPRKTARYHITPSKNNHLARKGAPGLAYHDFIRKNGMIHHCNSYEDITWHAGSYNRRSIGIALAFKGQTGDAPPSQQYRALLEHVVVLCLYLKILPKNVIGHRETPRNIIRSKKGAKTKYRKTCPGMGVDLDDLRHKVTLALQRRLAREGLYRGQLDGLFGPLSREALRAFRPKNPYV